MNQCFMHLIGLGDFFIPVSNEPSGCLQIFDDIAYESSCFMTYS